MNWFPVACCTAAVLGCCALGHAQGAAGIVVTTDKSVNCAKTPTVLTSLKVTDTTMLNFYSRPWLEAGKNLITVSASNGEGLAKTPLEITWRWLEDWTEEKTVTHKIVKSGQQETISVGGQKRPKMKSVTIACPATPAAGLVNGG